MLINDRAKGIPRTINVLADNALVAGFALEQRPVTSALVREVCRDFDIQVSREDDDGTGLGATVLPDPATPSTSILERRPSEDSLDSLQPMVSPSERSVETTAGNVLGDVLPRRRFSF